MLKKVLAILLSMVMLFSVTSALAADINAPIQNVTYTENFDQYTYTEDTSTTTGSYPANTGESSTVFNTLSGYKGYTIDVGAGRNNSNALRFDQDKTKYAIQSAKSVDMSGTNTSASNTVIELSYWINILSNSATGTETIKLGGRGAYADTPLFSLAQDNGTWKFKDVISTTPVFHSAYNTNTWYKVVIRQTLSKKEGWILDENGNILASAVQSRSLNRAAEIITALQILNNTSQEASVLIDDAVLRAYNQTSTAPAIVSAPSISGSNSVNTNTSSVTVVTDQPISTSSSTATLSATGDTKTCTITKDTTKYNTYTISWQGTLLGNTAYTLDLSGLKNSSGLAVGSSGTYTFTTAEAQVIADVTSSTPANGAENVSVDTKSMAVTFNTEMTAPQTVSLTGGSTAITANVTTTDNKTFTFTWTEELAGLTTYSVNLTGFVDANGVAPTTTSVSFTTENTAIVKLTDEFETDAAFTTYAYNVLNGSGVATVTSLPLTTGAAQQGGYTTKVTGYDGYALQISTGGTGTGRCVNGLRTISSYAPAVTEVDGESVYEKFVVTYRFNLKDAADTGTTTQHKTGEADRTTGGSNIWIGAEDKTSLNFGDSTAVITTVDGVPKIGEPGSSLAAMAEVQENHWYNIIWTIDGNEQTFYFIDEATGSVVWSRTFVSSSYSAGNAIYVIPHQAPRYYDSTADRLYNENQATLIDDFTLWKIKPSRAEHKLALTDAVAQAIAGQTAEFTLSFNQPVMADKDMVALYIEEADGNAGALKNELAYSVPTIKYTDFCTQTVSFADLANYTSYTVDYSGITGTSGADLGSATATSLIEFTTLPASEDISVLGSVALNGLTQGSVISAELYSQEAREVDIIAAFYNRSFPETLSAVQLIKDISLVEGINDVDITLNKDVSSDYVRLYVWDGISTMVPLMEEYKALAPVDSLDVLMIGNSLSEDAQRYLNKMAQAGGLDLNLTVKGVGGASLTHHTDNLKAELAAGLDTKYNTDSDAVSEYINNAGDNTDRILYFTYENGVEQTADTDKLLISALMEKQYDIISLQQFEITENYEDTLPYLTAKIRELQPNAEIVLYQTWPGYSREQATRLGKFADSIKPDLDTWAAKIGKEVSNITVCGEEIKIIPAGHAFYVADGFYDWCGERYGLTAGNTEASAQTGVEDWFNTSLGLWRDGNHGSYYGCYLADAVWYESLTGKRAPIKDASGNAIVPKPTGVGPVVETDGENITITTETMTYFTEPTDAEHLAKLQQLSDIAHRIVLLNNN